MDQIVDQVVKLVFDVAVVVLVPLVVALAVRLLQKVGLSLSAENQAKLEKVARDGIMLAEERAAAAVRRSLPEWSSGEKLQAATRHLLDQVPGITTMEAERIVTAELPKVGVGAAAFLAATRQAVTGE